MARPRKPTALLEASGAFKKHPERRSARGTEPQFVRGAEAPGHLTGEVLKVWQRIAEALDAAGVMRQVHAAALEGACVLYQRAIEADAVIAKEGPVYETETKTGRSLRLRPEVGLSLRCWDGFRRYCAEFGLTPAAMAKLAAPGEKPMTLNDVLNGPLSTDPNLDISRLL